MKSALPAVLVSIIALIVGYFLGRSSDADGRFVLISTAGSPYRMDTRTGQTWEIGRDQQFLEVGKRVSELEVEGLIKAPQEVVKALQFVDEMGRPGFAVSKSNEGYVNVYNPTRWELKRVRIRVTDPDRGTRIYDTYGGPYAEAIGSFQVPYLTDETKDVKVEILEASGFEVKFGE